MAALHVVPVWTGYSVEESFDEIETMGRIVEYRWWWRVTRRLQWAIVRVREDGTKEVVG